MRSNLPPEAYSKELLADAFNWLQGQSDSIRELVQNPEQLIALYRKHHLRQIQNDAPVSSKQFVSELKNLAKGLEEFSTPPAAKSEPSVKSEVIEPTLKQPTPAYSEPRKSTPAKPLETHQAPPHQANAVGELDLRTSEILQETRRRFNLSSDTEALRMLVALGYEKISKI